MIHTIYSILWILIAIAYIVFTIILWVLAIAIWPLLLLYEFAKKRLPAVHYYTEKDLLSFGNYLLSVERFNNTSSVNRDNVTDANIANWKEKRNA